MTVVQIDKNVEREIVNHRTLLHPNIIKFREVMPCIIARLSLFLLPGHEVLYSKQSSDEVLRLACC